MPSNIILVHTGEFFPSHINDCIYLAEKYGNNIHLIIDEKFHSKISSKKCTIVNTKDIVDVKYYNYYIDNKYYDPSFRDNFFTRTSSRFILIDNYISIYNIENCFHIENDIALFINLDYVNDILKHTNYDTALIMDNPNRCVPSLIWYKNKISSNRLANFIYNNNNMDDMKNLAIFFHKNRNTVTNLPIVPSNNFIHKDINFGNMYDRFLSIFDGAAIGQYLFGIDPICSNGQNSKGFINESSIFDPSKLDIRWMINSFLSREPCVFFDGSIVNISNISNISMHYMDQMIGLPRGTIVPINNLHIHSKQFEEINK